MKGRSTKKPAFRWKGADDDPRPKWPRGKPIPTFESYEEEVRFWHSYDFDDGDESEWEQVEYVPRATSQARPHVYRIRFSDEEMATLQALAKRRGVPASVIVRDLVRAQRPALKARKTA